MANKIIVLDRDGVINLDSDHYIRSVSEWSPIGGSIEAIARLKEAGYRVAIATNQSGIGRGYFTEGDLRAMHHKLTELLALHTSKAIDLIVHCPHTPADGCRCRKPATGMLEQIEAEFGESLADTHFVGDSLRDLECAVNFSMKPILVKTGKGLKTLCATGLPADLLVVEDLADAVSLILSDV